jgi:clan AA aspartic protease
MGAAMTEVKMWNLVDLEDARRGFIPPEAVRTATVEAMVDTGAVMMAIPEDVALALGLRPLEIRSVTLADGSKRRIPKVGGMAIEILGRQMTCDAFVTPTGAPPLIGQIPLEGLDLIVDPGSREVRVRLESGPESNLLRAAA